MTLIRPTSALILTVCLGLTGCGSSETETKTEEAHASKPLPAPTPAIEPGPVQASSQPEIPQPGNTGPSIYAQPDAPKDTPKK